MLLKVSKERDTQGQRESWGGEGGRREAGCWHQGLEGGATSSHHGRAEKILSLPSQTIKDPDSGFTVRSSPTRRENRCDLIVKTSGPLLGWLGQGGGCFSFLSSTLFRVTDMKPPPCHHDPSQSLALFGSLWTKLCSPGPPLLCT